MEVAKLSDLLGPARSGTSFNQTSLVSVPTSTVKARSSARKARSRWWDREQPRRAMGYCSPAEFEQKSDGLEAAGSATEGSLPETKRNLLQGCREKGLKRRSFPRPHPCLENQRHELQYTSVCCNPVETGFVSLVGSLQK
jgi:hypothetical protein